MAVFLITGADGQLGSELKEISKGYYGYDFVFTDVKELDITDAESTAKFISDIKPDWIINCAAYNLVDMAESEPDKAMLINSRAVSHIAEAISGTLCRLIHFSTDYVFGGSGNTPYAETAPVNPAGAYARSKYEGEKAALKHNDTMVVRTSWLYSTHGNNFMKTILSKARETGDLRVVFDQTGTPTWAFDLATAIMHIASGVIRNQLAFSAGIYNYSNEGVCTWYDFAREIVLEAGIECSITPVLSREYHAPAVRPAYSVLNKLKIRETYNIEIPHWRTSLRNCIGKLNKSDNGKAVG